jgi:outer membrane receptor protein involved in Fe transport
MKFFIQLKHYLIAAIMVISVAAMAQEGGTVTGKIIDKENGEALPGAQIFLPSTSIGTLSDVNGNYSLDVPAGKNTLQVSFVGYHMQQIEIDVAANKKITQNFSLESDMFGLDEVVVTATFSKRTQFEAPISMTAISAKKFQKLSASSQADILRIVPGIHAEGGGGEVASNVFIRGLPSGGQYQFTPIQIDGIPVLSAFGLNSSAHDVYFRNDLGIRNVEFVKGGVSTLFGAGSVAGIINYNSVRGSAVSENKVQLEWANGGRTKADFLTSGAISDKTFYSFSGTYRYDEGPLQTGLPTVGAQIRGNIKTLLNEGKGTFTVYGQYIDDKVQFYLPYPLNNDNGTYTRPVGNDGETIYTMLTSQATDFSFNTPNGVYHSQINNGVMTKGGYIMANLHYNFDNNWTLSSKVKYADYQHQFNLFLDGDGTHNVPELQSSYLTDRNLPANATFTYTSTGEQLGSNDLLFENRILDRNRPMSELVGEANLSKKFTIGGGEHNVTFGTFNSYTTARDDNWIYNYLGDFRNAPEMVDVTYTDSLGGTVDYTSGGYVNGSGRQTSNRYHAMKKNAFYLADEIKWDRFSLDAGVRFEKAKGFINRETGIGTNTFQKGEVEATGIAVALAGLYKMTSHVHLYANFSKGYFFPEIRSVKFISPGVTQSYSPENIIQSEIGAKFGYEKFAANVGTYFVALSDRRSVDFVNDGSGGVVEQVNVQSTQTIGIEANASYYFTKALNAFGNVTFQDHKYTKVEANPDQVGNMLRRQPKFMGMIGLAFDNSVFDASISSNYIGDRYANDANTVKLAAYNMMRLDGGYTMDLGGNHSLRLGFSVFNLTNVQGITEGSPRQGNSQISGGEFFVGRPILPRRFFIRATFSF